MVVVFQSALWLQCVSLLSFSSVCWRKTGCTVYKECNSFPLGFYFLIDLVFCFSVELSKCKLLVQVAGKDCSQTKSIFYVTTGTGQKQGVDINAPA